MWLVHEGYFLEPSDDVLVKDSGHVQLVEKDGIGISHGATCKRRKLWTKS